VYTPSAALISV